MKKTVVHIAKATGIHGTEKHLLSLLPELNKKYEILFVVLTEPGNPAAEYFNLLKKGGINTRRIDIRFDIDPICFWKIFNLIKKTGPSIVHTHLIHGDIYGITASWLAGINTIISTKHNDDSFRRNRFWRAINIFLNSKTSSIISISNWIRGFVNEIEGVPTEKIKTIYYGLGEQAFAKPENSIRDEKGFSGQDVLFGIIARLVEQKGHCYLIEAFSKAFEANSNIRLLIVGDGEQKTGLQKLVQEKHLERVIIFTGYRKNITDILDSLDIFIHPSLWEGFGLAVLEAMSRARPVITTKVSATPELIEDNVSGILVPPQNIDKLAEAILSLALDENLRKRLGQNAAERCKELFSVQSMVKKTQKLYEELM